MILQKAKFRPTKCLKIKLMLRLVWHLNLAFLIQYLPLTPKVLDQERLLPVWLEQRIKITRQTSVFKINQVMVTTCLICRPIQLQTKVWHSLRRTLPTLGPPINKESFTLTFNNNNSLETRIPQGQPPQKKEGEQRLKSTKPKCSAKVFKTQAPKKRVTRICLFQVFLLSPPTITWHPRLPVCLEADKTFKSLSRVPCCRYQLCRVIIIKVDLGQGPRQTLRIDHQMR